MDTTRTHTHGHIKPQRTTATKPTKKHKNTKTGKCRREPSQQPSRRCCDSEPASPQQNFPCVCFFWGGEGVLSVAPQNTTPTATAKENSNDVRSDGMVLQVILGKNVRARDLITKETGTGSHGCRCQSDEVVGSGFLLSLTHTAPRFLLSGYVCIMWREHQNDQTTNRSTPHTYTHEKEQKPKRRRQGGGGSILDVAVAAATATTQTFISLLKRVLRKGGRRKESLGWWCN